MENFSISVSENPSSSLSCPRTSDRRRLGTRESDVSVPSSSEEVSALVCGTCNIRAITMTDVDASSDSDSVDVEEPLELKHHHSHHQTEPIELRRATMFSMARILEHHRNESSTQTKTEPEETPPPKPLNFSIDAILERNDFPKAERSPSPFELPMQPLCPFPPGGE